MLSVYGLKNCDSCRKAVRALNAAGINHQFVDVRADNLDKATIKKWLSHVNASVLVNTRSTTWRALDKPTRARADNDAAGLLSENPTLIKRPVIDHDGVITVGWTSDVQSSLSL